MVGAALDQELDEELQSHLEHLIDANVTRGLSPDSARRAALIAMGGLQQRKEECRERRRVHLVDELLQDARYAGRSLRQSPGFTLAAFATLTLGIGASVALQGHNTTFASLATFSTFDGSLAGAAEPVLVRAGSVTSEFFAVLYGWVAVFAICASLVTAMVFGLVPALRLASQRSRAQG